MTRAVIYMRRSESNENQYTFETQEDDCTALAARSGYTVVGVVKDDNLTGHDSLDQRPGLKEVRRMVRSGEVDIVLVWKYDRLARDFLDQAFIIREAKMLGARVESATEPVPDGAMGWVMQAMHGGMSEMEWHKTKERLRSGVEKRVAHGKYLASNRAPYGYQFADGKKARLVPDPLTAPIVGRIFELSASGVSNHEIARILTHEGIPSPSGKPNWHWSVISNNIIRNPLYVGVAVAFRTRERTKYVLNPVSGESTQRKVRVPGEKIVLPDGTVPALVSPELAQRAQQYIEQNRIAPLSGRVRDKDWLLRGGFVVCGICGRSMSVRTHGRTAGTQPIYRCARNGDITNKTPHSLGISVYRLDEYVWSSFVESVSQPGVVEQAMSLLEQRRGAETAHQLTVLHSLLDDNQEQQNNLRQSIRLLKNETAIARLSADLDKLADDETGYRERISVLEQRESVLVAAQKVLRKFAERRDTDLSNLTLPEKRRLLFDFGVHVTVHPSQSTRRLVPAERCDVVIDVLRRALDTKDELPRDRELLVLVSRQLRILLVKQRGEWSAHLEVA